ncbi:MAG: sodium-dependent transporter, partial [Planctomycetes bacterium]|nr:sodium-dependent transporter [Planctomycetota bacterium]
MPWAEDPGKFLFETVLHRSEDPWAFGGLSLPVVLGLVVTWLAVFLIIHRGLKVVSKVVMVTVPLPVILLAILLVRGLTLDGAEAGLAYYLTPDFAVLKDPQVWLDAYGQIFFSLTLGFGVMIAYASYEPKRSDVNNDCFIISLGNCGTSFFAGFVVFSTLGYLAALKEVAVSDVAAEGIGLAFIAYPEAIARMPAATALIGVLFFLALLTLGIDSLFSIVEAIITGIHDKWPIGRDKITAAFC